uniref:Uncharacterized protein n=1 Tax=Anguilla anguilla TaxID=7936 RepID=A0A0E9UWR8_ANGAN
MPLFSHFTSTNLLWHLSKHGKNAFCLISIYKT